LIKLSWKDVETGHKWKTLKIGHRMLWKIHFEYSMCALSWACEQVIKDLAFAVVIKTLNAIALRLQLMAPYKFPVVNTTYRRWQTDSFPATSSFCQSQ